jgi:predicted membrane-bound mannosyltransferase
VIEPLRAMAIYLGRGIEPVSHAQPWHYYLGLLTYYSSGGLRWSEGLVLALAIAGVVAGVRGGDPAGAVRTFWARHLAGYTCISAAVYSAIPYKTPWNLLPFYAGALVLAGIGFSRLLRAASSRSLRGALLAACLLASGHLGWQAWRASVTFASDPCNPYVYAQTVPDAVRMAARIRALAAVHPDGDGMPVAVVAPPHEQWPLPWYLRTMPHVGFWTAPGEALAWRPPVIVTSLEHAAAVEEALGEGVVSEFYGLRPDVLLALHVERGQWDRFLSQAASGAPAPVGVP